MDQQIFQEQDSATYLNKFLQKPQKTPIKKQKINKNLKIVPRKQRKKEFSTASKEIVQNKNNEEKKEEKIAKIVKDIKQKNDEKDNVKMIKILESYDDFFGEIISDSNKSSIQKQEGLEEDKQDNSKSDTEQEPNSQDEKPKFMYHLNFRKKQANSSNNLILAKKKLRQIKRQASWRWRKQNNVPITPQQKEILQNICQIPLRKTLTFYKKINYREKSLTKIVNPSKQQRIFSKNEIPLVVGKFNSLVQISDNRIINTLDPSYSQTSWNVLRRQRNFCNCTKSLCQKSYCECYVNGRACGDECKCKNCKNFMPRKLNQQENQNLLILGCLCVKSNCLSSYCKCKRININCGEHCGCSESCKN